MCEDGSVPIRCREELLLVERVSTEKEAADGALAGGQQEMHLLCTRERGNKRVLAPLAHQALESTLEGRARFFIKGEQRGGLRCRTKDKRRKGETGSGNATGERLWAADGEKGGGEVRKVGAEGSKGTELA